VAAAYLAEHLGISGEEAWALCFVFRMCIPERF
jgi:hypothetical protein